MLELWMVFAVCTRAYYRPELPIYLKGQKFSKTHFQPFELMPTKAVCHHMNQAILKSEIWLPEDSISDSSCWLHETWIFQPKWYIIIQLVFPPLKWWSNPNVFFDKPSAIDCIKVVLIYFWMSVPAFALTSHHVMVSH